MDKMNAGLLLTILYLCCIGLTSSETIQQLTAKVKVLERKLAAQNRKMTRINNEVQNNKKLISMVDELKGVLSDKPACPNGVEGFYHEASLGSCYKLEPNSVLVNSTQAETLCQGYSPNSHLVSIESEEEQKFLTAMWSNQYGRSTISRFWTSAQMDNGNWRWGATGKKLKYEHWIPTTDHNDERFLCMGIYSNEAFFWADVACWAPHAVTCEITV